MQIIGNVLMLLIVATSLIYAGICIYAYSVSDAMIFPAPPSSYTDGPEIIKLATSDGETVSAYYLEVPDARQVLLYSHGNAEDLGTIRPLLMQFQQHGIAVLAYDYPGYGTSSGHPSESGVYAAADAAYQYLTASKGYPPEAITLYGRSLGSGPACWLAVRYPVGGLILDGAFSSTFRVMTSVKVLPFDKFDNLARLPRVDCPVLLIHGELDTVIPFSHARTNTAALKTAPQTLWVQSAGHNNLIETAGEAYWNSVMQFIHK